MRLRAIVEALLPFLAQATSQKNNASFVGLHVHHAHTRRVPVGSVDVQVSGDQPREGAH
jgi:hypothetical protein